MRPKKTHKSFTLFRKKTKSGALWYARFWDESSRRYAVTRSTGVYAEGKKQRRYEAEQAAREILPVIRFAPAAPEKSFIRYVADFWLPNSPYVRECALIKKKPLSVEYVKKNHENVRRHIEPFPGFQGVTLQGLTRGMILDWMAWATDKGASGRVINMALQGMRIAVRYAVTREEILRDPFLHIKEAPEKYREKGILSFTEVSRIIAAPVLDTRARLAVLLGLLCGLRRGEVRGLQWGDIANGIITVCHNYQEREGLKSPKCGSRRQVPVPNFVQLLLDALFTATGNPGPDDFVMAGLVTPDRPLSTKYFQRSLAGELSSIGITGKWTGKGSPPADHVNEQRHRNLTFHSLRHTFITLGRLAGISDLEIQAMAGHKSGAMMEHYSHASQVLDFNALREKMSIAITKGA